ncbi:kinase-like domain-containing protein [Mycena olivaceomarginata]|nr:kinase-like domain-containing protein [Mycena olivaceomarginata]
MPPPTGAIYHGFDGSYMYSDSPVPTIDYRAVSEVHFNEFHRYLQAHLARVSFLPLREEFHPKRKQARQKLATLPITRFEYLSSDVYFETVRRYPEFREDSSPRRTSADRPGGSEYGNSDSEYGGSERDDSSTNQTNLMDVSEHMDPKIFVVPQLVLLLQNPDSCKYFLACRGTDAQRLLDLLQDMLTSTDKKQLLDLDSFSSVKPVLFKALLRLSRASGLHPRCFALCGLQKVGQQVTGGGFGDIWKGLIHGQSVSVKIMRIFEDSDVETVLKEFSREALIWRQLCHPNVLPFFGLYYLENRLCLVSPWMENGHIVKFLKNKNPSNKARLSLILDVALGLRYLHGKKRSTRRFERSMLNILVTPSGRACITDFGVSSITNAMTVRFTHSTTNVRAGTARYQAPELFRGESQNNFSSDVYAFACVCYEIMTGKVPFYDFPNDMAVMFKVVEGEHPSRPMSCSGTAVLDSLWELLQNCWGAEGRDAFNGLSNCRVAGRPFHWGQTYLNHERLG